MLDFLKKKNKSDSKNNLDDLPPAPKPNSSPNQFPAQDQAQEPYIPPIPKSETPAPPPPSSFTAAPVDTKNSEPEEELEPLPSAPNIPEELLSKEEDSDDLSEPAPISRKDDNFNPLKPVNPKDIDPRDLFDDILRVEQTPELPAPGQDLEESESIPEPVEEISEPMPIGSDSSEEHSLESETEYGADEETKIEEPSVEEFNLPSADELVAKLEPVLKKDLPATVPPQTLPEIPLRNSDELPSFGVESGEPVVHSTSADPNFALLDMNVGKIKSEELAIYISVNDYALVTQTMRKLLNFFKKSNETLELADKPEKIRVLNELYKDLNNAQKSLMEIDKKLFERDL